jgi:hypothetical protein
MKKYILYLFLVVISNPYEGIDYSQVNTYDVNYCSGQYCPDTGDSSETDWDAIDAEQVEDLEEDLKEEYKEEQPLIFPVDFFKA